MKKLAPALMAAVSVLAITSCGSTKQVAPLAPIVQKQPANITIAFGGDTHGVEQISRYLNAGGDPFTYVKSELTKADISVLNLESAVTTQSEHQDKKYIFNSNPTLLDRMKVDGVDVVNIGNNHAGDYLRAGVTETIKNLTDRGFAVIGAGNSGREAWTAKEINVRGTKIAFLGIAKINGGAATVASGTYAGTTDGWDDQVIELAIKAAAKQAKAVIVYTHWGVEEKTCPAKSDVAEAQKWLDWGATAIIGSHPHRQQPYVLKDGKLVDYSIGNFVFYSSSAGGQKSGIGILTLDPNGKILDYKFKPAQLNYINGTVQLLSGNSAKSALAEKQRVCSSLKSN